MVAALMLHQRAVVIESGGALQQILCDVAIFVEEFECAPLFRALLSFEILR